MSKEELQKKRSELFEKAESLNEEFANDVLPEEKQAELDSYLEKLDQLDARIEQAHKLEKARQADLKPVYTEADVMHEVKEEKSEALSDADMLTWKFTKYLQTGKLDEDYAALHAKEHRKELVKQGLSEAEITKAMNSVDPLEGGVLVPVRLLNQVIERLRGEVKIRQFAKVFKVADGRGIDIPTDDFNGGGTWLEENETITATDPNGFGSVRLRPHLLGALVNMPLTLIKNAVIDLEAYIADMFARRLARVQEQAFFTGNGPGQPKGMLLDSNVGQVDVLASAAANPTYAQIVDLTMELESQYNDAGRNVFIMHRDIAKRIMKVVDSDGAPIFLMPRDGSGMKPTLLGVPVILSEFMNASADITASDDVGIIYGNLDRGYAIADGMDLRVDRSEHHNFAAGQISYRLLMSVDGHVLDPNALKFGVVA